MGQKLIPENMFRKGASANRSPKHGSSVEVEFARGVPVLIIDGNPLSPLRMKDGAARGDKDGAP